VRSPLAQQVPGGLDPAQGRVRKPWGLCVHTTGSGVPTKAAKSGRKPIDVALEIYLKSQRGELHPYRWGGPTYVLDHDGTIYQIAPDEVMTAHCGGPHRAAYLDGSWATVSGMAETVKHWRDVWPAYKSPQHLYPTRSPNECYIGLEMIPLLPGQGEPMAQGLRFTKAQHDAVIRLARDLAKRHAWPAPWARTSRLVGHEDVQPLERHDRFGGWDPGWLRGQPYFDFNYVRDSI
jgi:hypothetical protein